MQGFLIINKSEFVSSVFDLVIPTARLFIAIDISSYMKQKC